MKHAFYFYSDVFRGLSSSYYLCSSGIVGSSVNGIYVSRHIGLLSSSLRSSIEFFVGLRSGVPVDKGALTVNRLCGSGFQAVVNAAHVSHLILMSSEGSLLAIICVCSSGIVSGRVENLR